MATPGMAVRGLRRDPRSGWLAFALTALGGFVLVALFAMAWPAFDRVDASLSAGVRIMRDPALTQLAKWLTFVGSLEFVVPGSLALVLWMTVKRNWAAIVYVVMTVGLGWFLGNDVIKNVVRRPRPHGVSIVPIGHDFSLPSGHSLAGFLFFTTLCVIVMLNMPTGHHVKRWLAIASAVVIVGIGWSRVYLGVHYVGDVIAAYLLGGAWWSFTTATYFGSVTEEKRVGPRAGGSATASE